jgi:hypothetical protein
MIRKKLKEILESHKEWLNSGNGFRADLSGADLSGANLRSAYLRSAYLSGADLSHADLSGAYLSGADLRSADLSGANLRSAYLRSADLRSANLRSADLRSADLSHANLRSADLRSADLSHADLSGAYLSGADLRSADLSGVIANEHTSCYWLACPETGEFTAYKKCRYGAIVTLLIPSDAKRSSATSRKCRASKAIVISIDNGSSDIFRSVSSQHDLKFIYRVGETVEVPDFDENRWNECSSGIHFFITRREAEIY